MLAEQFSEAIFPKSSNMTHVLVFCAETLKGWAESWAGIPLELTRIPMQSEELEQDKELGFPKEIQPRWPLSSRS
jgi:hypothetical protein